MKKSIFTTFAVYFCALAVCGCQSAVGDISTPSSHSKTDDFSCLPGEVTLAFPVGESTKGPSEKKSILPDTPWKKIAKYESDKEYVIPYSVLLQKEPSGDVYWVNFGDAEGIVTYSLNLKKWEQYIKPTMGIKYLELFLDQNNEVWAYYSYPKEIKNILFHLDKEKKQFDAVIDQDGLLLDQDSAFQVFDLQVDRNGIFWMILYNSTDHNESLISFDPFTKKVKIHLTELKIEDPMTLSSNNEVFIFLQRSNTIIEYNTQTERYKKLQIPIEMNSGEPVSLYFDKEDRLWVDNAGYFDLSVKEEYPQYYQIVRPSVFLVYINAAGLWRWSIPTYTFESTNGLLWYTTGHGTGWVDPKEGKWCIFTSFNSPVQEDSNGNLWILIDDTLYKLDKRYAR